VAGVRTGADLRFGELEVRCQRVLKMLLGLDSRQRIRRENVRIYAVPAPVPIFKDPLPKEEALVDAGADAEPEVDPGQEPQPEGLGGPTVCPVCNREVHSFNLQHDTKGRVVGCFICGGDPGFFKG